MENLMCVLLLRNSSRIMNFRWSSLAELKTGMFISNNIAHWHLHYFIQLMTISYKQNRFFLLAQEVIRNLRNAETFMFWYRLYIRWLFHFIHGNERRHFLIWDCGWMKLELWISPWHLLPVWVCPCYFSFCRGMLLTIKDKKMNLNLILHKAVTHQPAVNAD